MKTRPGNYGEERRNQEERTNVTVTGQTGGRWPTNATKKKLIQGPVPTPYTIVPHSVWLTFHRRRMVRFKLLYISRA